MKTKEECVKLTEKLKELTEDELKEVAGGEDPISIDIFNNWGILPTIMSAEKPNNKD